MWLYLEWSHSAIAFATTHVQKGETVIYWCHVIKGLADRSVKWITLKAMHKFIAHWTSTGRGYRPYVVSEMTYTMSSGTLNSTIPYHTKGVYACYTVTLNPPLTGDASCDHALSALHPWSGTEWVSNDQRESCFNGAVYSIVYSRMRVQQTVEVCSKGE